MVCTELMRSVVEALINHDGKSLDEIGGSNGWLRWQRVWRVGVRGLSLAGCVRSASQDVFQGRSDVQSNV